MKSKTPSCHSTGLPEEEASPPEAGEGARAATILVGNPNVGKSVLFKNLTHRYVTVSNFPGTTVEMFRARASFNGRDVEVIDTPGINDLTPSSEDARVTRALLEPARDRDPGPGGRRQEPAARPAADARSWPSSAARWCWCSTWSDELEERGGMIDTDRLSDILGVPVVTTVAIRNEGTDRLIEALAQARPPRLDGPPLPEARRTTTEATRQRVARANEILAETYSISQPANPSLRVRLGFWAMHPVQGLAFMAVVTLAVFWFVGLFGAGTLVDVLEVGVFEQRLSPLAIRVVDAVLPFPHVHETGLISHALAPATHAGPRGRSRHAVQDH